MGRSTQDTNVGLDRRDSGASPSEIIRPNPNISQVSEAKKQRRRKLLESQQLEEEKPYLHTLLGDISDPIDVFCLRVRKPPQSLLQELANRHTQLYTCAFRRLLLLPLQFLQDRGPPSLASPSEHGGRKFPMTSSPETKLSKEVTTPTHDTTLNIDKICQSGEVVPLP